MQALDALHEYRSNLYSTESNESVFAWEKRFIEDGITKGSKAAGITRIRVHDLRHSHASLLINMGCNIVLISKRLGHENVSITLDTYGHLYPTQEDDMINKLENLKQ